MQAIRRLKISLFRLLVLLAAGSLTTLALVALGVYRGPHKSSGNDMQSPPVFAVKNGFAFLDEVQSSRLLTSARASLLESPTRKGSKPSTIEVPESNAGFSITTEAIRAFLAGNDTFGPEITPQMLDSEPKDRSAAKTLPRFHILQFQVMQASPLQTDLFADRAQPNIVEEFSLGFPFRALWTADRTTVSSSSRPRVKRHGPVHWISIGESRSGYGNLNGYGFTVEYGFPTGLIPLGFAANTTIYATAWLALLAVPGFIRRCIAQHKNVCTQCRYNLQGLASNAPCPECGGEHTTH